MTYRINGLNPADHSSLFTMSEAELAAINARRVTLNASVGFPCRVSLKDADEGDQLILFHHVSHDVATPYRSAYAIYVREVASEAAEYVDETPPVFEGRPIALRAFDEAGNLQDAALALPGQADARICELFANEEIAYIHAHNAAHRCFSAKVERN
jgi:plasmid replication initiation protein